MEAGIARRGADGYDSDALLKLVRLGGAIKFTTSNATYAAPLPLFCIDGPPSKPGMAPLSKARVRHFLYRPYVGQAEIVTLEQERLSRRLRQRIGEAVAVV